MHTEQITQRKTRWALKFVILGYVFVTFPLLCPFCVNRFSRSSQLRVASHYVSKATNPITVHIGDSLTAGGGDWSVAMHGYPFRSINLAGNGYTVRQIEGQLKAALSYKPRSICVMAGTNDILGDPKYDRAESLASYSSIVKQVVDADIQCVVTLVPFTANGDEVDEIVSFNLELRRIAEAQGGQVCDLNPKIAPEKLLLGEFTTDGVHFSDAAYSVWVDYLCQLIH